MAHLGLLLSFVALKIAASSALYSTCNAIEGNTLSDEECLDLYFEPSEKNIGDDSLNLAVSGANLNISTSSRNAHWKYALLRLSYYNTNPDSEKNNNPICAKILYHGSSFDWFYDCFAFNTSDESDALLLEYSAQTTETVTKKITFYTPNYNYQIPIFSYIDFSDTLRITLKVQKLPDYYNVTYYKVEVFKEKNENVVLQDLQLFSSEQEIRYEFSSYNDEGDYFFNISIISEQCPEDLCPKATTPRIHIGRKSTRLVIGIVGASFILPFVLFIFHILTRQYKLQDDPKIVLIYKAAFKKHDDTIASLAKILQKVTKTQVVLDPIDAMRTNEKFCSDNLILASHIVYVAPPLHQLEREVHFEFNFDEKDICSVIFDYCSDKVPDFFANYPNYRLLDEFDKFIASFKAEVDINKLKKERVFCDLVKRMQDAKFDDENLPKIVVTEFEPGENDSLLSPNEKL